MAVEHIVDDVSRFQRALQDGDVSLRIEKPQDVLPVNREKTAKLWTPLLGLGGGCGGAAGTLILPDEVGEGFVEGPVLAGRELGSVVVARTGTGPLFAWSGPRSRLHMCFWLSEWEEKGSLIFKLLLSETCRSNSADWTSTCVL